MTPPVPTIVLVDDAPEVRALVRTSLRLSGDIDVVG
jgi:CheY-like chemotaxis protein